MKQDWKVVGDYYVEIWFPVEKDSHGYPQSVKWEQLLARPVLDRDDYFRIDSIPFYLKSVSRGDIVRANARVNVEIDEKEVFIFEEIIDRGKHNTYRLLLRRRHPDDPAFTTKELTAKGLEIETQSDDFFAVDVPPSIDQKAIDDFLVVESDAGRWEMQDGYLHTIKIEK
jgi:hypothetical protein